MPLLLLLVPLFFYRVEELPAKYNAYTDHTTEEDPDQQDHRAIWFGFLGRDGDGFNNRKYWCFLPYLYFSLFELLG